MLTFSHTVARSHCTFGPQVSFSISTPVRFDRRSDSVSHSPLPRTEFINLLLSHFHFSVNLLIGELSNTIKHYSFELILILAKCLLSQMSNSFTIPLSLIHLSLTASLKCVINSISLLLKIGLVIDRSILWIIYKRYRFCDLFENFIVLFSINSFINSVIALSFPILHTCQCELTSGHLVASNSPSSSFSGVSHSPELSFNQYLSPI